MRRKNTTTNVQHSGSVEKVKPNLFEKGTKFAMNISRMTTEGEGFVT